MTTKYTKYRVTSRSMDGDDKMTVFVPWHQLEDYVGLMLGNCMICEIDGGVREEREDD